MLKKFSTDMCRMFHTTRLAYKAIDKTTLSALRKKTGFTFANCKKALELHKNDIVKAENWLNEQAQSFGWTKASKLADRATAQGLVGVLIHGNIGAMVEVNCETDFVARNEHFKNFVSHVSHICAKYTQMTEFDGDLWKLGFEAEAVKNLRTDNGKTLGDHLALLIGTVGENAVIKRAICFKTSNDLQLAGYTHPAPNSNVIPTNITQVGKYGAIVAMRGNMVDLELQKNLCRHIVGLNPQKIGEEGKDIPIANKDNEPCLIYQEYLIDSDRTVGDVLKEEKVQVIDYQRYECGEMLVNQEYAEAANTCRGAKKKPITR